MYIQAHIHIHKIKRHLKNLKEFTTLFALFIFLIFLLLSAAVSNCCGAVLAKRERERDPKETMLGDSALLGGGGGEGGASADVVAATATHDATTTTTTGGGGGGSNNSGDDERGRIEEGERSFGGNRWPRQETLALLRIRSDMDVAFRDASVKGPLWEEVSRYASLTTQLYILIYLIIYISFLFSFHFASSHSIHVNFDR